MKLYVTTVARFCVCSNNYLSKENVDNLKNSFGFNMASWDAQDQSCQAGNYLKLVVFNPPPNQSTFANVCINWISMVTIQLSSNNLCPCVCNCVNVVK